ncbi:uncharacterized protein [Lolium perenne]|uniref:uncharacterized protein isoform X3 n=1 Tax=Lolium perenne TaxID=4522 RepID=UPI0021F600F5|nr:uncharacterized protein LOC127301461 isoform X9 [Lolium perenne]
MDGLVAWYARGETTGAPTAYGKLQLEPFFSSTACKHRTTSRLDRPQWCKIVCRNSVCKTMWQTMRSCTKMIFEAG